MIIRWVGDGALALAGLCTVGQILGVSRPVTVTGGLVIDALAAGAALALILASLCAIKMLRGRRRLLSALSLLFGGGLAMGVALAGVSAPQQATVLTAGGRFWTLFDIVLYSIVAIVLLNLGFFNRGDRDGD